MTTIAEQVADLFDNNGRNFARPIIDGYDRESTECLKDTCEARGGGHAERRARGARSGVGLRIFGRVRHSRYARGMGCPPRRLHVRILLGWGSPRL
jgi:hypothetical protein